MKLNKIKSAAFYPWVFIPWVFIPTFTGLSVLVIIVTAFAAGAVRHEPALILTGAVFMLPWAYCLLLTLLLALIHRRRARRTFIRVSPCEIPAGSRAGAICCQYSDSGAETVFGGKTFKFPGILIRCRLLLYTADGRRISHDFDPSPEMSGGESSFFTAEERGAYFSLYNEFAVFDVFGFFRFAWRLPAEHKGSDGDPLLLVWPQMADETPAVTARSGDSDLKPEFSYQRTDDFVDHRPYVPGDDPRRINWKLYSHGGGLFVREGEFEPPPHSNITILIDTEYDPSLYSLPEARIGIDSLCENALAAALACKDTGMDVLIEFTGKFSPEKNKAPELLLAWPAARPVSGESKFPAVPADRGLFIFALPCTCSDTALDRFLKPGSPVGSSLSAGINRNRQINLLFICDTEKRLAAAETCAALYNRRQGVKANIIQTGKRDE